MENLEKSVLNQSDLANDEIKLEQQQTEIQSVDVYNALNLYNEELGKSYKKNGFNPFDDNFVLTEEFTNDILENKKQKVEVFIESFLEQSNKEVSKHFEHALANGNVLLSSLYNELNFANDKDKKQIQKAIIFLKNRNVLLKISIKKLKNKDANALKMYLELFGLDSELSELLKDTFNENANNQIIIQNMLKACHYRACRVYVKSPKIKIENIEHTIPTQSQTSKQTKIEQPIKQVEKQIPKIKEQPKQSPTIKHEQKSEQELTQ